MKVTVCMITYNQERYVEQAIRSVLEQVVDFQLRLVISDDCSTDGTVEIIEDLRRKYPGNIVLLTAPYNQGMQKNFVKAYESCKSDYVAFLEGDDYWVDSNKLRKQVNMLERDRKLSMIGHQVMVINESGCAVCDRYPDFHVDVIDDEFWWKSDTFIPTSSIVCRRSLVPKIPLWIEDVLNVDFSFCSLFLRKGKIMVLQEVLSVYRRHSTGVWAPLSNALKYSHMMNTLTVMFNNSEGFERNQIAKRLAEMIYRNIESNKSRLFRLVEASRYDRKLVLRLLVRRAIRCIDKC